MPDVQSTRTTGSSHRSISQITTEAIARINNEPLAAALDEAFRSCEADIQKAQSCFEKVLSRTWPLSTLELFFRSWKDTHLTMTSMAALVARLLKLADETDTSESADAYRNAAYCASLVMGEDLGLTGDTDHAELFDRMATGVCGGTEWELSRNRAPSTKRFRDWVYEERVSAPDLAGGLMLSVGSEIYNHGEMVFLNQFFERWQTEDFGFTPAEAKEYSAYVEVHAHGIETDHFSCGFGAVESLYQARGEPVDYAKINKRCKDYLIQVGTAFQGLEARIA